MGGMGSGGHNRRKGDLSRTLSLSVKELRPKIKPNQAKIEVRLCNDARQTLSIKWAECNLGGERPWLVCPRCDRPFGTLYTSLLVKRYACRDCAALNYPSSRRNHDRMLGAQTKIMMLRHRLKPTDRQQLQPFEALPPQPKGMHGATYAELAEAIRAEETKLYKIALLEL